MSDAAKWNERYQKNDTPWDMGRPSSELQRVLAEIKLKPCRALEIGCGTGTNSVWLAQQGFDVTGLDLSERAIERARQRAKDAGVAIDFRVADVLKAPPPLGEPFAFFFDRGCYHAVRRDDPLGYGAALVPLLAPGAVGLVLTGNAREPNEDGPPVVSEEEIRAELGGYFQVRQLREFRFDARPGSGENFLAWSCLLVR
jgi:methyl halide transferase